MVEPIALTNRKQLFIDSRWFAKSHGVALRVNPPTKADMVFVPERPWEGTISPYSNIVEHEGIYKMWYLAHRVDASNKKPGDAVCTCYAESTNGIDWERPNLGLFSFEGVADTNIVMPGASPFVMIDPNGPDEHRYKSLSSVKETDRWSQTEGCIGSAYAYLESEKRWVEKTREEGGRGYKELYLCTSADGLRWNVHHPGALPFYHDSHNQVGYDTRLRKYVAYVRWHQKGRAVSRTEFDDPIVLPWPFRDNPKAERGPGNSRARVGDEMQVVLDRDEADPVDTDLYTPGVHQYPWAADAYFSFVTPYRHYPVGDTSDTTMRGKDERGRYRNDGPVDVQLAVSRDGIDFSRPDRKPYVGLGIEGSHDGGQVYMTHGMVRKGDEIWQYYVGTPATHGAESAQKSSGIRRVVQRLDGFMSADAEYTGADFTTPLLTFTGSELTINVDCSAMGEVWVEIRDDWNHPIPGYSLDEAISIDRNHVAAKVRWRDRDTVEPLIGRPVRLHFKLRACKLYAFQFVD